MKNLKMRNNGFTLVELIIVILVLLILGTIGIVSYFTETKEARDSLRKSDLDSINKVLSLEKSRTGELPMPLDYVEYIDLDGNKWYSGKLGSGMFEKLDVLSGIPIDPKSGENYIYELSFDKRSYKLKTNLEYTGEEYVLSNISSSGEITGGNSGYVVLNDNSENTTHCDIGQHLEGSVCVNNTRLVPIENGICEDKYVSGAWIGCNTTETVTCNSGYSVVGNLCEQNTCATQPTYTHASYTIGTPTQPNQSRQNTNNTNPCYYTCTDGYTGTNCEIAPIVQYTSNCTANGQIYYADSSGNKLATVTNAGVATWESGKSILDLTCAGHIIVCSGSNTGYTLQACNLGATTLYTDQTFTSTTIERSTAVDARAGYLYQWGRNKGFTGPVTQQKTTIAGTVGLNAGTDTYGFVWSGSLASPYTWANSDITNNWGDTTGTSVARQGPCASGYHVPAQTEWSGIVTAGGWGSNGTNLMNSLKMPMAGYRTWNIGTMLTQGGRGYYWSSSPYGTYGYYLLFGSSNINPGISDGRAFGFSLRCIKN